MVEDGGGSWAAFRDGWTWTWEGPVGLLRERVGGLRAEARATSARLEGEASVVARRERLAALGARAGRSKGWRRFSKGYWKFFKKAVVKPKKGCILLILPGVLAGLFACQLFGAREEMGVKLGVVVCLAIPIMIGVIGLFFRDPGAGSDEERQKLRMGSTMPILLHRLRVLDRLLEVVGTDVDPSGSGTAVLVHMPWCERERPAQPSRVELRLPLRDGNALELEWGYGGDARSVRKGEKLKRVMVVREELLIRLRTDESRYGVRDGPEAVDGPGRLGTMTFSVGDGTLELRAATPPVKIALGAGGALRMAGVPSRLFHEDELLAATSCLYGRIGVRRGAIDGEPIAGDATAESPAVAEAAAADAVPDPPTPKVLVGASPHASPVEGDGGREIVALARAILADGIITGAEKKRLEEAVAADGMVDGLEHAVLLKVKELVRSGRVKVVD